jgi:LuxR family maltose regulon positive regulatory protein
VQCLCLRGVAAWAEGDQRRAAEAASDAIAVAAEHAATDSPWSLGAHAVLAHAALLRSKPATALLSATEGLRAARAGLDPAVQFALRCAHGGAVFDNGDRAGGLLELQQARAALGDTPLPSPLAATAALLEHGAALQLGHRTAAAGAAAWLAARGAASLEVSLLHAWTHAAAGSISAARVAVAPVLDSGARPVLTLTAVEAWLIEARAALAARDRRRARHALHKAVALAEPTDTVRPFAFIDGDVRGLLVDQLSGVDDPTVFAARALVARQRPTRPTGALLSARERDVLARLPSLDSLDEIASDLAVSINTVKSHVRAIYGKLGVTSRRDAVLTAHEQGLLT